MLAGSIPNFATSAAFVDTATKWRATSLVVVERLQAPRTRGLRVGEGLLRGEGLRADNEQSLRRVEVPRRLGDIGRINVRDETNRQRAIAVRTAAPRRP